MTELGVWAELQGDSEPVNELVLFFELELWGSVFKKVGSSSVLRTRIGCAPDASRAVGRSAKIWVQRRALATG